MNPITRLEIYAGLALILALAIGGAYLKGEKVGEAKIQEKFDLFVAQVNAAGEKARADALTKEKENETKIAAAVSSRDAALNSLRQASARLAASRVPLVPAAAAGSNSQCFSPKALTAAVESYRAAVFGLVAEGERANIDAAALIKAWPSASQSQSPRSP